MKSPYKKNKGNIYIYKTGTKRDFICKYIIEGKKIPCHSNSELP